MFFLFILFVPSKIYAKISFNESVFHQLCKNNFVPNVDSLIGETSVCLNIPYTYKASKKIAGTKFTWFIQGSGTILSSSDDQAQIVYNTSGTRKVGVVRTMLGSPFCNSHDTLWLDVQGPTINNIMIGDSVTCANGLSQYSLSETNGYDYVWKFKNSSHNVYGSMNVNPSTPYKMSLQWNNFPASATSTTIRVEYVKCGFDTFVEKVVQLNASPTPQIQLVSNPFKLGPDTICEGSSISYTSSTASLTTPPYYSWTGTDITIANPSSKTTNITIPQSGTYTLNLATSSGNCTAVKTASRVIFVLPKPNATLGYYGGRLDYCPPLTTSITGTVSVIGNGIYTFQIKKDNGTIGTSSPFTVSAKGSYYAIVTDQVTGCSVTTNGFNIIQDCGGNKCDTPDVPLSVLPTPADSFRFIFTNLSCNQVNYSLLVYGGAYVSVDVSVRGGDIKHDITSSTSGILTFSSAGRYGVHVTAFKTNSAPCRVDYDSIIEIPLVASMDASVLCVNNGKRLKIRDKSTVLKPDYTITNVTWAITNMASGAAIVGSPFTGSTVTTSNPLPTGKYIIHQIVTAQKGTSTTSVTCDRFDTVDIVSIVPSFTIDRQHICTGNTVTFTSTSIPNAMIQSYRWIFQNPPMVDYIGSSTATGQFMYVTNINQYSQYYPKLEVTDKSGCIYQSDSFLIRAYNNLFNGSNKPKLTLNNNNICADQAPVVLTATSSISRTIVSYLWNETSLYSAPNNTYSTYSSGLYHVRMRDQYGCIGYSDDTTVYIAPMPTIQMIGKQKLCLGEPINLTFDAGSFGLSISPASWAKGSQVYHIPTSAGTYSVSATATSPSSGCTTTYVADIEVSPKPTLSLTQQRISCVPYAVELAGRGSPNPQIPLSTAYLWGHGPTGPQTRVYQGGSYNLLYTNDKGCHTYDTIIVEKSLRFLNFPEGCFRVCRDSTCSKPILINLSYDRPAYDSWAWKRNDFIMYQGTNSQPINPLSICYDSIGGYSWTLTLYHHGCSITSTPIDIQVYDCGGGGGGGDCACPIDRHLAIQSRPLTCWKYRFDILPDSVPCAHINDWTVNGVWVSDQDMKSYTFLQNGIYRICYHRVQDSCGVLYDTTICMDVTICCDTCPYTAELLYDNIEKEDCMTEFCHSFDSRCPLISATIDYGDGSKEKITGQNKWRHHYKKGTYTACITYIIQNGKTCIDTVVRCWTIVVNCCEGCRLDQIDLQLSRGDKCDVLIDPIINIGECVELLYKYILPDGTVMGWYDYRTQPPKGFGYPTHFGENTICMVIQKKSNDGCIDSTYICRTWYNDNKECDCHCSYNQSFRAKSEPNKCYVSFESTVSTTCEYDRDSMIWQFGDGESGYGALVDHHYRRSGFYSVCLTIVSYQYGIPCRYTTCQVVYVSCDGCFLSVPRELFQFVSPRQDRARRQDETITPLDQSTWNVYPNPANDKLYIQSTLPIEDKEIVIYSMVGLKLYQGRATNQPIDLSRYANDTYFAQMVHHGIPIDKRTFIIHHQSIQSLK